MNSKQLDKIYEDIEESGIMPCGEVSNCTECHCPYFLCKYLKDMTDKQIDYFIDHLKTLG